jgi:tetratricopeptide (TPR) repeat protein
MILKPLWNRIFNIVFIAIVIVGILALGRVAFVMGMAQIVNSKAAAGTYDPAEVYYLIQSQSGDFMEPYKAYYNAGTAYAKNKDYESADFFLTEALARVNYVYNECYIRNNLAYVDEKLGDYYVESDMKDTAEKYYDKAVKTVQEAPVECFPPPPSGGGGKGEDNNPVGKDEAKPDTSENGKEMKKTEDNSQSKGDEVRKEQGDKKDGKEQVQDEQNQSNGENSNKEDQDNQEQNKDKSSNPIEKPW